MLFRSIIKKTNQNYWLSHGSLLGAIRHNSVVPWDDDLDIAYPRECLESLIKIVNENDWKFTRLGPFHAKIWNEKMKVYSTDKAWTWPFCDIALYDTYRNTIIIEHEFHTQFKVFKYNQILPTKLCKFGPLQMPVPNESHQILKRMYPNWDVKPTSGRYNHRSENFYAEPVECMDIDKLSKIFNIIPNTFKY